MTAESFSEMILEVEQLVKERPAAPDDEALRRIQRICFSITHSSGATGYIREKCVAIASQAEIYFSVRKHDRYAQGGVSGGDFVRQNILAPCSSLRRALSTLDD